MEKLEEELGRTPKPGVEMKYLTEYRDVALVQEYVGGFTNW